MFNLRRSREGAWIESLLVSLTNRLYSGRSREGAWIESYMIAVCGEYVKVAPARERGLKEYYYWDY